MKFNFNLILVVALCACTSGLTFGESLISDGRSSYSIVINADAIPSEKKAAAELQTYLKKITGVTLAISQKQNTPHAIFLGQTPEISRKLSGMDFSSLKPDEIIIKTLSDGDLILTGSRPRGTLYAVYTFLEDFMGVRWWSRNEEYVPHKKNVILPEMNFQYAPPFMVREASFNDLSGDPIFSARQKNNGRTCWNRVNIPVEYGGCAEVLGFGHTFGNLLIRESKYFKSHPEWFAEISGKRSPNAQLCLTNKEMKKELIKNALSVLRKHPDQRIISISQNDNCRYCRCKNCKLLAQKLGNQTDLLIWFLNNVAEELAKEKPDVLVETLAYQYTRKPPKRVKPSDRLMIRLCTIEADFAKPLNSSANKAFKDDLEKWHDKASNMSIWNYATNFINYPLPHPNMKSFATDLRFFRNNGVVSVYEQGDYGAGQAGFLSELKAWVLSHLMWNPKLNQDELIKEFLNGYYGAAAPYIEAYIDLLQKEMDAHPNVKLKLYMKDTSPWLSLEKLDEARKLMNEALAGVSENPVLKSRVMRLKLSTDWAWLWRSEFTLWGKLLTSSPRPVAELKKQFTQVMPEMRKLAYANGKGWLREGGKAERIEDKLKERLCLDSELSKKNLPEIFSKAKPQDIILISPGYITLFGKDKVIWFESDKKATGGKSLRMNSDNTSWGAQLFLPDLPADYGVWDIYAEVRCDASKNVTGGAITAGVFDGAKPDTWSETIIPAKEICGPKYKFIKIGETKLGPLESYWKTVYLAPIINKKIKHVYFNRIVFLRAS